MSNQGLLIAHGNLRSTQNGTIDATVPLNSYRRAVVPGSKHEKDSSQASLNPSGT